MTSENRHCGTITNFLS
ncbi:unnamed protein product [Acanthoscelides obtectus]|uniref:Uncharacterized protein n=1 Tax=Acanthoscelides obtectus TaxID=200917 RepID=A0A9P0L167_ACAOB|nr:unnamed protein product [Acanthoscelides obtectus]CAK1681051.1 hypothetical protein AOBTE_LOCUS32996 [Acanthoscelides obtectus]